MHREPLFVLSWLLAVACNDKGGDSAGSDGSDDTGDPPIGTDCKWQTESDAYDLDGDGVTVDNETCSSHSLEASEEDWIDGTGSTIQSVTIYGHYDAEMPDEVRAWRIEHADKWEGDPLTYPGAQVTTILKTPTEGVAGIGYDWFATYLGDDELDGFDDCEDHCEFYDSGTEIPDDYTASIDNCGIYDSSSDPADHDDLELCIAWDHTSEEPKPPPESRCTAGRGTFQLIPLRWQDWNGDGSRLVQWKPVMETGRGAMTSAANITKVKLHDDNGAPMRVIYKDQDYWFSEEDALEGVNNRTSALLTSGVNKNFTRSQLPGSPIFISEDYPAQGKYDMEVDMTWSCSSTTSVASTPVPSEPQGYSFSLGDLGCPISQKLTVRPIIGSYSYVTLELYGTTLHSTSVPLKMNDDIYYFDVNRRGFKVQGYFDKPSANPDDGLDVTFTEISYRGIEQCDLGSYNMEKEQ